MVQFPIRQRLTVPVAPLAAVVAALLAAAAMLFVTQSVLDAAAMASGLPALLPAAEPPLGLTARLALMVTLGGGAAAVAWFATFALVGARAIRLGFPATLPRRPTASDATGVARAPLVASRELGTPFLEVRAPREPAERPLPADLDAPLAAFDPNAIPKTPADPVPLVAPLARPRASLAPGERLEAFELPTPIAAPQTEATIHALLTRLERGVATRTRVVDPHPPRTPLDATLGELRRLATGR